MTDDSSDPILALQAQLLRDLEQMLGSPARTMNIRADVPGSRSNSSGDPSVGDELVTNDAANVIASYVVALLKIENGPRGSMTIIAGQTFSSRDVATVLMQNLENRPDAVSKLVSSTGAASPIIRALSVAARELGYEPLEHLKHGEPKAQETFDVLRRGIVNEVDRSPLRGPGLDD